jgi:hypothetical protein
MSQDEAPDWQACRGPRARPTEFGHGALMIDREPPQKQELQVSNHYKGIAGAHYVKMRQKDQGQLGYTLDVEYFKPTSRVQIPFSILAVAMVLCHA